MTDSESFKIKSRLTNNINNAGIANVEIAVPLKNLSNFWKNLEILLINCIVNIMLIWLANCVIWEADRAKTFAIADTKLYVPVATLLI